MNKSANERKESGAMQAPLDQRRLIGIILVVVLATWVGVSFVQKPSTPVDAKTLTVEEGVAAFKAGAFDVALGRLKPLAEKGNAQAAYWVGRMYEEGLGVKKDSNATISWYVKAGEGGWTDAQFRLGEMYLNGTEQLQDFGKARIWLGQAAHEGNTRAQLDLGRLYANGWGGDKDPVQAYVWYEFSAKQGNYEAQRLRDELLKTMQENEITEAQKLTETMAPQVFGQNVSMTNDGKTQDATSNK